HLRPLNLPTQNPPRVSITVDDREQACGLPQAIARAIGWFPNVERLTVADVRIGEHHLVERKSAADFVASVLEGRLDRQIAPLAEAGGGILMLEGSLQIDAAPGVDLAIIRMALISVALDWRIPVL